MKTIIGSTIQRDKPFTKDELLENDTCYINCKFIISKDCKVGIEFGNGPILNIDRYFIGCAFIGDEFTGVKHDDPKLSVYMSIRGIYHLLQRILNKVSFLKSI